MSASRILIPLLIEPAGDALREKIFPETLCTPLGASTSSSAFFSEMGLVERKLSPTDDFLVLPDDVWLALRRTADPLVT